MRIRTVFKKLLCLQGAGVRQVDLPQARVAACLARRVVVVSTSHRIACPEHGVVNEAFPWAAPGSLFTLDFEALVAWLAREMNKTAVAALAKIS